MRAEQRKLIDEARRKADRAEFVAALVLLVVAVLWWLVVPDGFGERRLLPLVPYVLFAFVLLQWGWSRDAGKALQILLELELEAKEQRDELLSAVGHLSERLDEIEAATKGEIVTGAKP